MSSYRFRVMDGVLVLQVVTPANSNPYFHERTASWRDATVEDIPVMDPFGAGSPMFPCIRERGDGAA